MWKRYRFKTKSVNDWRPLIYNPQYPSWCSGYAGDMSYAIIICFLPDGEDLCKYIIETYSKQGEVVLDFTAGSGTTAIGVELGRTVVLVEKNLNEFEKLKERWEEKIIKTD